MSDTHKAIMLANADGTGDVYSGGGGNSSEGTGIPPRPANYFRVVERKDTTGIYNMIDFDVDDTVVEHQTICYVGRVVVVRKTGTNASSSPSDGTLIFDATKDPDEGWTPWEHYKDRDITVGTTYTYTCFVYSDHGICNLVAPDTNKKTVVVRANPFYVFGFHQDFTDLNPETTISYNFETDIFDVENKYYQRAMTNVFELESYGLEHITIGSWGSFLSEDLNNHMYRIDPSTVTCISKVKDDQYGYHECEDGTDLTSFACAIAPWINTIYMYENYAQDGNSRDVYFVTKEGYDLLESSQQALFYPVGFVDPGDNVLEGIILPGSYLNDASGTIYNCARNGANIQSKTTDEQKTLIDAIGSRAKFCGGPIMNVLRDLEYMIFKSTDIQKAAGYGNCNGYSSSDTNYGMTSSRIDDGYLTYLDTAFTYGFGQCGKAGGSLEKNKSVGFLFHSRPLGTYDQYLRDPYTIGYSSTLYMSPKYAYDLGRSGYVNTGVAMASGGANYPSKLMKPTSNPEKIGSIQLHSANTGSTTTGLCDVTYGISNDDNVALRLGYANNGLRCGPAFLSLSVAASIADWLNGAATLLLPAPGYAP